MYVHIKGHMEGKHRLKRITSELNVSNTNPVRRKVIPL
jgi:hypothetical protein